MWNKSTTVKGRWDYFVATGTGDMPSFEHGGHVEESTNGDDWLYAYDKKHGFINNFLELDDAKKAVEEASCGRKYF